MNRNRDNVLTNFRGLLGEVHLEDQVCMEWSEVEKVGYSYNLLLFIWKPGIILLIDLIKSRIGLKSYL